MAGFQEEMPSLLYALLILTSTLRIWKLRPRIIILIPFYIINTHADSLFRTVMGTLAADIAFLILLNVAAAGHFFLDGFKGFFRNDCIMMVLNLKPLSLPLINDALLLWVRAALDLTIQDQIQARPDGRAYKA